MKHRFKQNKNKNEAKTGKEKVLGAHSQHYKGRCHKCSKYGHEPNDPTFKKNKNEIE